MVDFSNIKAQDVQPDTTREYVFDALVGEPSLLVAPAHDSNPAFLDERLRLATERAAAMKDEPRRKGGGAQPVSVDRLKAQFEDDRDYDRRILAAVCIKSWGETPPVDVSGKPVKFSPENALAFLEALPVFLLDPFRAYASNIFNFVERPRTDPVRDAALGES